MGRLPGAPKEYKESSENDFRRDLGVRLEGIDSKIDQILGGSSGELSKMASRASLLSPPAGFTGSKRTQGSSTGTEPAYGSFNKTWGTSDAVTHTGVTLSSMAWFTEDIPPTVWTRNFYKDWEELGPATGRLRYTGSYPASGSRKFLINWGMNLYYYSASTYLGLAGRITKTPAGGSAAEVAGSAQTTSWDHYLVYLGSNFYMKYVGGTAMVSISAGDTIQFEYGVNSVSGSGTTTVVAYRTYESGITVNIVSMD